MKKILKGIEKSVNSLAKSRKRLIRAKVFRLWVESNSKINLVTYPYYRIRDSRLISLMIKGVKNA